MEELSNRKFSIIFNIVKQTSALEFRSLSSYMKCWHEVQDRQQKISRNKHGPCITNLHINSRGPVVLLLTLHNAAGENSR